MVIPAHRAVCENTSENLNSIKIDAIEVVRHLYGDSLSLNVLFTAIQNQGYYLIYLIIKLRFRINWLAQHYLMLT